MIFLSEDDLISFNSEIIPNAIIDRTKVEAVINRVLNAHYYDGVSDLFELAALYLIVIGRAHIFLDGNKRTAFQSMALFLLINGVDLRDDPMLEEMTVEAAQGKLTSREAAVVLQRLVENVQGKE